MFSLFSSNPARKLRNRRKQLLRKAMITQRSGDLRSYATLMKEVEEIEIQLSGPEFKG